MKSNVLICKRTRRGLRRHFGFSAGVTLVEVLVTICILGVLGALLFPALTLSRARGRTAVCVSHLRSVGQSYAALVLESSGYLPDAFYEFEWSPESWHVILKDPEHSDADNLITSVTAQILMCPSDDDPVDVLSGTSSGPSVTIPTGYAYNVGLPILFKNASRVSMPANTVTFYDGNAGTVVGEWEHCLGWAGETIRARHNDCANYLYLDGHVETLLSFPDLAFEGGGELLTWPYAEVVSIRGAVSVNPNQSLSIDFRLVTASGYEITAGDLQADVPLDGAGFSSTALEYTGAATIVSLKPKALGLVEDLIVNGTPYSLPVNRRSTIASRAMRVHLYNDHRNAQGRAVGKWWIAIRSERATITVGK